MVILALLMPLRVVLVSLEPMTIRDGCAPGLPPVLLASIRVTDFAPLSPEPDAPAAPPGLPDFPALAALPPKLVLPDMPMLTPLLVL